jgi:hypothetical protein
MIGVAILRSKRSGVESAGEPAGLSFQSFATAELPRGVDHS